MHPRLVHVYAPPEESTLLTPNADALPADFAPTEPLPFEPITETFDAVVVCAALQSATLLAPHGLKLPLAPVYGYSVTAPMRHHENHPDSGPRSGLMDERYKVAISRMGSRIRVAGGAELGGSPQQHNAAALDTLYKVLHDWFPGVARMSHAQRWKGARPMLPDGPPVLGRSGLDGVWLNLGHGSSGWALSCGSARVVADLLSNRTPGVDIEGLGVERLRR
jgi:D-amino-acid dehydrogenase